MLGTHPERTSAPKSITLIFPGSVEASGTARGYQLTALVERVGFAC